MSQIYKSGAGGGPVPPTVPTSFTTDDGSIAIPAANNLNVLTDDTITHNDNGIQSRAIAPNSDNLYIELSNRIRVTTTTADATPTDVTIFTPTSGSAFTFTVIVTCYDPATNDAAGGEMIGLGKRSAGGTTSVLGTNDTFDESDAALIATDWDIVSDGTLIQIRFTGVAATTLNWAAVFLYDRVQ